MRTRALMASVSNGLTNNGLHAVPLIGRMLRS